VRRLLIPSQPRFRSAGDSVCGSEDPARGADIGPLVRPAARTGPGSYQATVDLPLAGAWVIEVGVRTSQFENPTADFPVEIR
jgi:hypothetical protein